jgi:F-type H+-transporting ATPase subunit b
MPQLDTSTYSSQLFWLAVCFLSLYFILSYIALPKIKRVLKEREETFEEKINLASQFRETAETLLAEYEETLSQAREEAQKRSRLANVATTSEMANKRKDFLDKMNDRLHLADQDLYRERLEVSSQIHSLAADVATEILLKVTGHMYTPQELLKKRIKTNVFNT